MTASEVVDRNFHSPIPRLKHVFSGTVGLAKKIFGFSRHAVLSSRELRTGKLIVMGRMFQFHIDTGYLLGQFINPQIQIFVQAGDFLHLRKAALNIACRFIDTGISSSYAEF